VNRSVLELPGPDYVLAQARVPACFLSHLPPGSVADDEGSVALDIVVEHGRVLELSPGGATVPDGLPRVDVGGRQLWATLVDMHAHLDKGQVIPRVQPDGTLEGGARLTMNDRQRWTADDIAARMSFGLRCAYVHGVSAIRTHLDSPEPLAERSWTIFRRLREEWAGRVALQAVAITPLAVFRTEWGTRLADLAAASGGVLGGVTDALGVYEGAAGELLDDLLDRMFRIAGERGLDVDLHVDQSDDLSMFALPNIARSVLRTKFRGRVVCGHCVNLALQPEAVARSAIALAKDAGLSFVTLPTPMMYLQDRRPGRTPRWRGVTLAKELIDAGVPVAIGGDNCRDAWFPFGDHDMIDTLQQSVRVFQLDGPIAQALAMAGPTPSDIIGAGAIGRLQIGAPADFIILAARTLNEAMCRPQSDRIVIRSGERVTAPLPDYAELDPVLG